MSTKKRQSTKTPNTAQLWHTQARTYVRTNTNKHTHEKTNKQRTPTHTHTRVVERSVPKQSTETAHQTEPCVFPDRSRRVAVPARRCIVLFGQNRGREERGEKRLRGYGTMDHKKERERTYGGIFTGGGGGVQLRNTPKLRSFRHSRLHAAAATQQHPCKGCSSCKTFQALASFRYERDSSSAPAKLPLSLYQAEIIVSRTHTYACHSLYW